MGREAGVLGDPRQHARPDLLILVKTEHEVRPPLASECAVRA
jgi:hypothetical protein